MDIHDIEVIPELCFRPNGEVWGYRASEKLLSFVHSAASTISSRPCSSTATPRKGYVSAEDLLKSPWLIDHLDKCKLPSTPAIEVSSKKSLKLQLK